jgi:hypothetical protein
VKPRLEILPDGQKKLWPQLAAARDLEFVLYGGTAVALQLGHRVSVDFDFFTDRDLDRERLNERFPFLQRSTAIQDSKNTFVVLAPAGHEHVKVSFFGAIDFGRINDPLETDDSAMLVASMDDLLASKLKVILQRSEAKDYRDIAAMLKAGVDLPLAIAAARQMYAPAYQPQIGLKALTFFGDGDLKKLSPEDKKILTGAAAAVRDLPPVTIKQGLVPRNGASSPGGGRIRP